jgi:hypothetical protein
VSLVSQSPRPLFPLFLFPFIEHSAPFVYPRHCKYSPRPTIPSTATPNQTKPNQTKNLTFHNPQTHKQKPKMCFSEPRHKHYYREEVVVGPRPVRYSTHSHHSHSPAHHHHHGGARSSYTQVTRTTAARPTSRVYLESPRVSTASYRRSQPVVVETRSSRQYVR